MTQNLPDETLLELCQKYGFQARIWKQKFLGLLPEVNRRKLYEKKGFGSIVEFAAKVGGVSKEQVKRVLSLAEHFEDKPVLKNLLENGKVSVNKLARVASIATTENEEFLADQVRLLPKSALDTLVRDEKYASQQVVPGHKPRQDHETNDDVKLRKESSELNLSDEVKQRLLELQKKGININGMILEFLEKRQMEIAQEKEEIAAEEKLMSVEEAEEQLREVLIHEAFPKKPTRYIPAKTKKLLKKEFGTKCSIQNCEKSAENIHHTQTFSIGQNHDPHFLAPLCKEHHVIAHSVNVKFQEMRKSA